MSRIRLELAMSAARASAVGLTATLAALLVATACGSSSSSVGAGGECFLATDCAPGLVCVQQANNSRICSDDLSRVAGKPPAEGGADAEADGEVDGSVSDGPVTPTDTGTPDTFVPPEDTGAPPQDSGSDT